MSAFGSNVVGGGERQRHNAATQRNERNATTVNRRLTDNLDNRQRDSAAAAKNDDVVGGVWRRCVYVKRSRSVAFAPG